MAKLARRRQWESEDEPGLADRSSAAEGLGRTTTTSQSLVDVARGQRSMASPNVQYIIRGYTRSGVAQVPQALPALLLTRCSLPNMRRCVTTSERRSLEHVRTHLHVLH